MKGLLLFLTCLISGCHATDVVGTIIDEYGFNLLGYTAFSEPDEVTLKEIHLDTGELKGREVVVEGRLLDVGDFSTFVILGDESARMLVILTKVISAKDLDRYKGMAVTLRVLGTISGGQMGLPFVDARAISIVSTEAAALKG